MQMECRRRTVLLATDVRLIHDSLEWAIGRRGGYSIVGAANDRQELLRLAASLKPEREPLIYAANAHQGAGRGSGTEWKRPNLQFTWQGSAAGGLSKIGDLITT
jgi:hypothetical protein